MQGTYEAVGHVMKFCLLLQLLEVMHPLFGYTKGGVLMPFVQVIVSADDVLQMAYCTSQQGFSSMDESRSFACVIARLSELHN
jgi:hypothetical protein